MYLFEARYINMNRNGSITRKIEINDQYFSEEKKIYLLAMDKAYEFKKENECFTDIKFIGC